MNPLVIIPARGGSKGIPGKNIKPLNGKPLIEYSIDVARAIVDDAHICVSTDDDKIIGVVESYGLKVPFKRPDKLATDFAGTYEVLLHALDYYHTFGNQYDVLVLLQPTSPFRRVDDIKKTLRIYKPTLDMVVGVKEATANPYYNCFEEDENGFLKYVKGEGEFIRRQDAPQVWEYNGAVYVINVDSLKKMPLTKFKKIKKYPMDSIHSIDLDTPVDWIVAETLIQQGIIEL